MAQIRTVASLADINAALQDLNINRTNQAGNVQFELHEQALLQDAFLISQKTNPGVHGFILRNPELMNCKTRAKAALEESFDAMFQASLERIDQELRGVNASLSALEIHLGYTDDRIDAMPTQGPPLAQRNRGVQQCIYPHPPFPRNANYEHGTPNQRVPYQAAYTTQEKRNAAAARDRRAQRAVWEAKRRILAVRQSVLREMRTEMISKMQEGFRSMMRERSDLGVGYADYDYPPFA